MVTHLNGVLPISSRYHRKLLLSLRMGNKVHVGREGFIEPSVDLAYPEFTKSYVR
ncbi:hypothetical protein GCM10007392_03230 [Saccharospirillum salsuginis]|uniref:Uncharacterized protein n=1 Tax=Saccharospirillum salsuginis TaxID=418750 RepID=A0A918K2M0_9GAMM|nr:hypothetical protein GCM10007392_03230 [Saccharospirillum salsuginis]